MLLTNILAVVFATLVAADNAEVQHEARAPIAGTLYSNRDYRGFSRHLENGRCTTLNGPLRNGVRSIRVSGRSDCYLYFQDNCRGAPTRQERSNPNVHFSRVRSARCVRDRR